MSFYTVATDASGFEGPESMESACWKSSKMQLILTDVQICEINALIGSINTISGFLNISCKFSQIYAVLCDEVFRCSFLVAMVS